MQANKEKAIIANISGFYGDRLSAAQEMLEGGPIDYLTGDYLAELTMAILYKAKSKRADAGYARTFLRQMEGIMGSCLDRGIKVVVNAGGLNAEGLAKALAEVAQTLQIHPKIASLTGDDLIPRLSALQKQGVPFHHLDKSLTLKESGMPVVTANAYLGCWGIVEALNQGADIVITGRVADTSLTMGPAAHHFGWDRTDWDALAGAAAVGHIIECSGQATGGNYSFFEEVSSYQNLGFPLAEVSPDGSAVITKHRETGGLVSVGTLTSQLLYEIDKTHYLTPDVIARFDTLKLSQEAPDRVQVSGVKGLPATDTAKVTANCIGGFRNSLTFLIAGLAIERKVEIMKEAAWERFGGTDTFDQLSFQFFPTHKDNPASNEEAMAQLKVSVVDRDIKKAGKFFTSKLIELALSCVPGFCLAYPPEPAKPRVVHFPSLIDKVHLSQTVHFEGTETLVAEVRAGGQIPALANAEVALDHAWEREATETAYFGRLFGARSGDKGGNANLGVWAKTENAYAFLQTYLTVAQLQRLLPDLAPFEVERYEFPNLLGLNFVIKGLLGEGVAATDRQDVQAKTLGEYLRAKQIELPVSLLK